MPEIIHSTEISLTGPWLIGREQLLALDSIVESEWNKLLEHHERLVNEVVNKEISAHIAWLPKDECKTFDQNAARKNAHARVSESYPFGKSRSLVIHLGGNRRVPAKSFEEAFREPALLNERSIGFTLDLEVADVKCALRIPYHETDLKLSVSPDREAVAKGLFAELRTWIDSVKPAPWQSLWIKIKSLHGQWFLWGLTLMVALISVPMLGRDTSATARSARQAQTVTILKTGVSETNHFKALELILSYESGTIPKERDVTIPSWFWWLLCGGPLFCVALGFAPSVILGIGKGEESIKSWNRWMKFMAVTFPLWVIGTFIGPKVLDFLKGLF